MILNGYMVGMGKTDEDMGTGMVIGLTCPKPARTCTHFFNVLEKEFRSNIFLVQVKPMPF